jgi:hypothetical protein
VELLFDELVSLNRPILAAALQQVGAGELRLATDSSTSLDASLLAALGPTSSAPLARIDGISRDTGEPPSWFLSAPREIDVAELDDALSQSWWWPEARAVAPSCRFAVRLVDHRMFGLDYRSRLRRIQQILAAAIETLQPAALHWPKSEQLLEPDSFLESVRQDDFKSLLPGAANVRFFQLEFEEASPAADVELLMDTRGLSALGLVDLQCHFRGLDPEDVSQVLYSTANYLFEHGRVIVPGNTVQGPGARDAWLCRLGEALGPPAREVLDLDPGFPFAAELYDGEEDPTDGAQPS